MQQQQPGVAAAAAAVASLLQNQGPTVKAAEAAPGAKRIPKKRKLISDVPGKAPQSIPESSLFTTLRKCEDSIDKRMRSKRNEVAAAVQQNPDQGDPKRLRLYIFHTHSHQTPARQQAFDAGALQPTEDQPSWTLWLSGRLEGPDADAAAAAAAAAAAPTPAQLLEAAIAGGGAVPMPGAVLAPVAPPPAYRHDGPGMTKALKRITITFTPADTPSTTGSPVPSAPTTVVWDREHHTIEHVDQLQVKCIGTQPMDASISIEVDWRPARFKLPPVLAQLLGLQWGSRDAILRALYAYIQRSSRVQTQGQGPVLVCDEALEGVFGQKEVGMGSVVERVVGLLEPMDPITLEHSIRLDGPSPSPLQHCFDIDVVLPGHPADRGLGAMFDKYSKDKEIETLNHKIDAAIAKIREHKRRHTLFMGFAQSPADFMTSLIASQARDLRIAKPHAPTFELQRRTETFNEKWVEDAATKFINRKLGIEF